MFSFDLKLKGSNLPDKLEEFIYLYICISQPQHLWIFQVLPTHTLKIACGRWKEGTVQEIRGPTGGGGGREHKKVETQ